MPCIATATLRLCLACKWGDRVLCYILSYPRFVKS